jgi:hypothetical protein
MTSTVHTATAVNVDPSDISTGKMVTDFIMAAVMADRRAAHLRKGVESMQFHRKYGVGVLCTDSGVRNHLANALHFAAKPINGSRTREGLPVVIEGEIFGVTVKIWNYEI